MKIITLGHFDFLRLAFQPDVKELETVLYRFIRDEIIFFPPGGFSVDTYKMAIFSQLNTQMRTSPEESPQPVKMPTPYPATRARDTMTRVARQKTVGAGRNRTLSRTTTNHDGPS